MSLSSHHSRRSDGLGFRAVSIAVSASTSGVLPVFLFGAVAVLVREDLGFSESRVGLAVSGFFLGAAIGSAVLGRIVERRGHALALTIGGVASALVLLGLGVSYSWWHLGLLLPIGGLAYSVTQLGSNVVLSSWVSEERLGLSFGIKQSAVPAATLLGGLGVPAVALTLGWRWVFLIALVFPVSVAAFQWRSFLLRPSPSSKLSGVVQPVARHPLLILGVAFALGTAPVTAMAAFVVEYGVSRGLGLGASGLILAAGSISSIVGRVGVGWLADRYGRHSLLGVVAMLLAGAIGFVFLPASGSLSSLLAFVMICYGIGWGWTGLLVFAVVRHNHASPAASSGYLHAGGFAGAIAGPGVFGFLVTSWGYAGAWYACSVSLVIAAALMLIGRRLAQHAWL